MNPLKALPAGAVRRSLTLSLFDGVLWAVMFGLAENFIVPFILLFGATVFQVSFLQGTAQLAMGVGQLAGASFIQRGGSRRRLAMAMVTLHAFSWLVIYWGTVWTGSAWFAIGAYCASLFVANFGGPGWMSWMNDLVPEKQRGSYWSFRNSVAGVTQLVPIAAAGLALQQTKAQGLELAAFGVLFFLAFLFRLGGVLCLAGQHEPPMHRSAESRSMSFLAFLKDLKASNFGRFVVFSVLLNFTIQMIYPIIQVYLLQELGFDYNQYTWVTMTFTIASFVFMLYWGPLSDRFGNRRILLVSALLLPLVAVGWIFLKDWWWLIGLQLITGFLVSGVNLSTTNFIFDSVKPDRMAKSVAYFTALNTAFGFLGSITGGAVADLLKTLSWHWGPLGPLTTVFLVIAVLRIAVLAGFAKGFQEVRKAEPSPGLHWFYIYKPWQDASGWITDVPRTLVRSIKKLQKRK